MRISTLALLASLAACGGAVDGSPTGSGQAPGTGAGGDDAGSDAAPPASTSPPRPACAVTTAVRNDFEAGLFPPGETWSGAPAGLALETAAPLRGKQSLRLDVARAAAYRGFLATEVGPGCAATLAVTVKVVDALAPSSGSAILVRLVARPVFLDLVLGAGGELTLVEHGGADAGAPPSSQVHALGVVPAGVATRIAVALDLSAKSATATVGPPETPGSPTSFPLALEAETVTNAAVGMAATSTMTSGLYLLDDFAVE